MVRSGPISRVTDHWRWADERNAALQNAIPEDEDVAHDNQHRPHRVRNLRPPDTDDIGPAAVADLAAARIRRRKIPGGLIHEYGRGRMKTVGRSSKLQLRGHGSSSGTLQGFREIIVVRSGSAQ